MTTVPNLKKFVMSGGILLSLLGMLVFCNAGLTRAFKLPYPRFNTLLLERYGLEDFGGILFGFRSAAADVAWIQFLQYLGGAVLPDENQSRNYDLVGYYAKRIIRIDPYYHSAILYGAGILAWFKNVNRPEEAVELLKEAISYEPTYWPYTSYLAAIAYKEGKSVQETILVLERASRYADCPIILKNMLSNIYKAEKMYAKAILLWQLVLEEGKDTEYLDYARAHIESFSALLRAESAR